MPEAGGKNIEIARELNKKHDAEQHTQSRSGQMIELIEAIILSLVAIATAWSGYQAAKWGSVQSVLYGRSSRMRVESQTLQVEANQIKQYNAATVANWLEAESRGDKKLADFYERRFLPEFRPAFQAWKKTDPLNNPNALAGPGLMPEYHDSEGQEADEKGKAATEVFEQGTHAREVADEYVRATVGLATVLFLTAMSQRFRSQRIRTMLIAIAFLILCVPLWRILTLPRV
jgi:heme/copper-type cytochrome/quinol oxidase subunit 4